MKQRHGLAGFVSDADLVLKDRDRETDRQRDKTSSFWLPTTSGRRVGRQVS